MIVNMEVLAVRTYGDSIAVDLQGATKTQASYLPMLKWTIEVPVYIGRKYRVGELIKFKVTR